MNITRTIQSNLLSVRSLCSIPSLLPSSVTDITTNLPQPNVWAIQSTRINTFASSSQHSSHTIHQQSFPLHHIKTISDLSRDDICNIIELAQNIRHVPQMYSERMVNKSLVMLFSKPSLRTRLSFEIGMTQLGGHAVYYELGEKSNLGSKETIDDTAHVISRYADIVMARVNSREQINKLSQYSTIPVINGLDDYGHPCQILADIQTIVQKKGNHVLNDKTKLNLVYCGDIANNVTYDWLRASAIMGWNYTAIGPSSNTYHIEQSVVDEYNQLSKSTGARIKVSHDMSDCRDADIIMTDSWMSYHLNKHEQQQRFNELQPYRITSDIMKLCSSDSIFMHCLPANRDAEVTSDVIDGTHSVVFDQAENRLHAQKALICWLLQDKHSTTQQIQE